MNVGLLYTPVSIYQMTRGALVLFVGVLSVIFLRRRLWLYQLSTSPFRACLASSRPFAVCWKSLRTERMLTLVPKMDIPYHCHGRYFPCWPEWVYDQGRGEGGRLRHARRCALYGACGAARSHESACRYVDH